MQLGVGQVIKGWDEGVMQMSLGERAELTCTPDFAYVSVLHYDMLTVLQSVLHCCPRAGMAQPGTLP